MTRNGLLLFFKTDGRLRTMTGMNSYLVGQ